MKERQRRLLSAIIEAQSIGIAALMERFGVSRRTLYYDIEQINGQLDGAAQLLNLNRRFIFQGSMAAARKLMGQEEGNTVDREHRRRHILRQMLWETCKTVEQLAEEWDLSRNTVVQSINEIRDELEPLGLTLEYKQQYRIVGDELAIRGLFVTLLREDGKTLHEIGSDVLDFNRRLQLSLTDFGLSYLHKLLCFVRWRIAHGFTLHSYPFLQEAQGFLWHAQLHKLLPDGAGVDEVGYISAFVATLPSLKPQEGIALVDEYTRYLADEFEARANIQLASRADFLHHIHRHIQSSYYRIKFRFPIYTPVLDEIRSRHGHLYKIVRSIIRDDTAHPEFAAMRDEEIYFITAYFGAYISSGIPKRVLIVCPSGLMISKSLELQLCRFIPGIRIVGTSSISALSEYRGDYDYIVSTVPIDSFEPVLVVSPLLSRLDIFMLMETLVDFDLSAQLPDLEKIMRIIGENCIIQDESRLYNQLLRELFRPPQPPAAP